MHDFLNKRFVRLRAVGIHFGISVFLFLFIFYFILFEWYSPPFFSTDGGIQGVRIVIFVDFVLGPVLTAVIFKPQKSLKKIRFDLTCIGIVQFTALCTGVTLVWSQRPIAIIHYQDAFYSITSGQLKSQKTQARDLRRFGLEFPVLLHHEGPHVQSELNQLMHKSVAGIQEFRQTQSFRPLGLHMDQVAEHKLDIETVAQSNPKTGKALDRLLKKGPQESLIFKYFYGRYGTSILAFSSTGQLMGHLPK
jgi:hypothetical protein